MIGYLHHFTKARCFPSWVRSFATTFTEVQNYQQIPSLLTMIAKPRISKMKYGRFVLFVLLFYQRTMCQSLKQPTPWDIILSEGNLITSQLQLETNSPHPETSLTYKIFNLPGNTFHHLWGAHRGNGPSANPPASSKLKKESPLTPPQTSSCILLIDLEIIFFFRCENIFVRCAKK